MRQAAALPYRHRGNSDDVELLLVTTRSKRWIIPKGDIDDGMRPSRAAEKEAFEEGGVKGTVADKAIGSFCFRKQRDGTAISIDVDVFPLAVSEELRRWPEMDRRERRWMGRKEAAMSVDEPSLQAIIKSFRPA